MCGLRYGLPLNHTVSLIAVPQPSEFQRRATVSSLPVQDLKKIVQCKEKCFELMHNGEIKGLVDRKEFRSLECVLDAIDYMLSGKAIGKVVVSL